MRRPVKLISEEEATALLAVAPLASEHREQIAKDTAALLASTSSMRVPRIVALLDGDARDTGLSVDRPLFQPFPSEAVFQRFGPGDVLELPLSFRNVDRVARRLQVQASQSPYFELVAPQGPPAKVAPGVEATYVLRFRPDEDKDYADELVCVTEREKFVVPVRALGSRAALDLPDRVDFGEGVVKAEAVRAMLVRNIGDRASHFRLQAAAPFSVSPDHGRLEPQASMQLRVAFSPERALPHDSELRVTYDTGEVTRTLLSGTGINANVRLERGALRFENTYLGLASQRTVKLVNRSGVKARFHWKSAATFEEEDDTRHQLTSTLEREKTGEVDDFMRMLEADPTVASHLSLLERKYEGRRREIEQDPQLYEADLFAVEPVEGEIWPNAVGVWARRERERERESEEKKRVPLLSVFRSPSISSSALLNSLPKSGARSDGDV
jgi:hydrocephalus-inducing protein